MRDIYYIFMRMIMDMDLYFLHPLQKTHPPNLIFTYVQALFSVMLREFGVSGIKVQEVISLDEEIIASLQCVTGAPTPLGQPYIPI